MNINWGDLITDGKAAIKAEARRRMNSFGTSAHIDAQNSAVRDFEALALAPHRSGLLSAAQAIDKIQQINTAFSTYCQELGYERALRGASEVSALAQQLIRDLNLEAGSGSGPGGGGGLPKLPKLPGGMDWTTVALMGGAAFLLLRKGRF